jgi:outer membrane receptor protein involved in Fe transport
MIDRTKPTRSTFRPPAVILAAAVLSVLALQVDASAQTRGRGRGRGASEESRRGIDTAAAEERRSNPAEEPTDLAVRTVNGTNPSGASRERSIAAPPQLGERELRVLDARRSNVEPLIPLRGYPTSERPTVPNHPGYVDARVGIFTTTTLEAGYAGTAWPFDYFGRMLFDMSSGYQADNGYRAIGVELGAGYIIDEGYGMFSGGHMGADVRFNNDRYHLFALASSPVRTSTNWSVATTGSNTSSGFTYDAGARYRSLGIDDSADASRETSLEGTLALGTSWHGLAVGAQGDMRLTYLDGASISYGRVQGYGSYSNRFLTARAGVALAGGENNDGSTSGTIAPTGELRLFPMHGLTLIGTVTGGLAPTSLAGLSAINPYVSLDPNIRHQREKIGYQIHARIEPSRAFALRASAARSHYNDYAYFDSLRDGRFAPQYGSAVVSRITGDLSWRMDELNSVLASAEFTEGRIDEHRDLPFTPKWVADVLYTRRFAGIPLSIDAGVRYIGARSASAGATLDPVALVNLSGRYSITQRIDLTADLRNVLDQRYELWEGYDERGVYVAVGASARF